MSSNIKTLGTLALIFGLVSLFLSCIPVFSVLLALTGVILGIISTRRVVKTDEPRGLPISGLIISIFSFLIGLILNFLLFAGISGYLDKIFDVNDINDFNLEEIYYGNDSLQSFDEEVDSVLLDNEQMNNLDNSMEDFDNTSGPAPD